MKKNRKTYHVIFRPEPEGGYTVLVPSLPGCISYGKTLKQAEKMATEAIELYLETVGNVSATFMLKYYDEVICKSILNLGFIF